MESEEWRRLAVAGHFIFIIARREEISASGHDSFQKAIYLCMSSYSSLSNKRSAQFINFLKILTCTAFFHPPSFMFINFGLFSRNLFFLVLIFQKFQPAQPYSILHVYWCWKIFQPVHLLHPAWLLDRLE